MTTLAADLPRPWVLGDFEQHPVIANDIIYEGAAVGDNGSGYARPLVAGDPFLGFAQMQVNNTGGSAGDKAVRVKLEGAVQLPVASVAITDVGKPVYASDDNTFELVQSDHSKIGVVRAFVSSGIAIVDFEATGLRKITAVTDSTSAAATSTVTAVAGSWDATAISVLNVNFATIAAKINALIAGV
jgi:hypothetical protein